MDCRHYPRVAIFDIDNTLTVAADHQACTTLPGPEPAWPVKGSGTTQAVLKALRAADDAGFKIALASAESWNQQYNDAQRSFLRNLLQDAGIKDSPLGTEAEQSAFNLISGATPHSKDTAFAATDGGALGMKEAMFLNILKAYDVPYGCFHNSVVIDDQTENLCAAHALGLQTIQSSPSCAGSYCTRGCGITPATADILKGLAMAP